MAETYSFKYGYQQGFGKRWHSYGYLKLQLLFGLSSCQQLWGEAPLFRFLAPNVALT